MDQAALSQTMLQSGKTIGTVHPLEVQNVCSAVAGGTLGHGFKYFAWWLVLKKVYTFD